MSLVPGTRVGAYEIVAPIGAGGMGEVFRAHDARLNRDVAIKVLPASVANDRDRLERFSREARAASSLNHPNILTIHEFGTHEGRPYIVSELLEGGDLRASIGGKPLPARRAVDYAVQILDGLAAAHEKGIIHRDLKPGNLFVTREGRVKILDFGLAKATAQIGDDVTRQELTGSGVVLGTAGYMAPEQIRGGRADQRSDLFSFGAVLYEMLSGQPAFARSTGVETMTAVLNDDPPDFQERGVAVNPGLDRIVRRCLEKSPERRFQSATDLAFAIGGLQTLSDASASASRTVTPPRWRGAAIAAAGVVLIAAIALPMRSWLGGRETMVRPSLELALMTPADTAPSWVALSPDGRWLAFAAATGSKIQLWVRPMGAGAAEPLAGTEGAALPFWSPDSRFIGFFAAGKLRKIEPTGGALTVIADSGVATGGTWSRDGVILFANLGGAGLSKVSANGGAVEQVLPPDVKRQETDYSNPFFLPDGRHFFFNVFSGNPEGRGTFVGSLDGGDRRKILEESSNVAFAEVPGAGTFLIFPRESALMAQRFDPSTLQLSGEAVTLAPMVGSSFDSTGTGVNRRTFTASNSGVIVLDPVVTRLDSHVTWTDRQGREPRLMGDMNLVSMARLSRDGRRVALARRQGDRGNADLWVGASDGGRAERLTFDAGNDIFPVWSPDGSQIAWASNRAGIYDIYRKASTGTGTDELLLAGSGFKLPTDWSPDGRHILYRLVDPVTHYDLWALPMTPGAKPFPVLQTPANEAAAVLSPDGKWMAYSSDETGRYEVYVQAFPDGGGRRQISTIGGNGPLWRGDGRELYFQAPNGELTAVGIDPATGTITATPSTLFSFPAGGILITPYYSPTSDGQRFLLSQLVQHGERTPLTVLVDWAARLTK